MERSTDVQLMLGVSSWLASQIRGDCPELAPRLRGIEDHAGQPEAGRLRVEVFRLSELLARVALDDHFTPLAIARG